MSEETKSENTTKLTASQRKRITENRDRAIIIKRAKMVTHSLTSDGKESSLDKATIKIDSKHYKDTGGGFLLEESDDAANFQKILDSEPPISEFDSLVCKECSQLFQYSYLYKTFEYSVCDACKDEEKHKLITRTDAKKEYLLKDCDLDKREPLLKFITKKNPHNPRWNNMKLYLLPQVEERALEVWGSVENLEKELESREEKKVIVKTKKYHKQMKELRMSVRSSLYDRTSSASHKHAFGPEIYNEDNDDYTHTCLTCGFEETFEKM